jgi:hypothetical protein
MSLRWEGWVEDRLREKVRREKELAEREAKRKERQELEQYMWKENRGRSRGGLGPARPKGPNPYDALVDRAIASASSSEEGRTQERPSFKRGKRIARLTDGNGEK